MENALGTLLAVWLLISILWICVLYSTMKERKEAFFQYVQHHQKFIALYVEVARKNRDLSKQYNNFKLAVADWVFFPGGYTIEQAAAWYKKYNIESQVDASESAPSELSYFLKQDRNETKQLKNTLT